VATDARYLADQVVSLRSTGGDHDVRWLAGTPASTYPSDDDWIAPRTVA
jgi:putative flavoprotein involved in K+ transport